jgi:hypothetical protein
MLARIPTAIAATSMRRGNMHTPLSKRCPALEGLPESPEPASSSCAPGRSLNDTGQKSSSGKFAEIDTDECFKADKSQGRFRRIIDF